MEFTAQQIAGILNGTVEGNQDTLVNNLSKIEEGQPKTLSFLANPKYEEHIYTTNASIVIVNSSFNPQKELPETCTLIKVEDAYAAFSKLLEVYNQIKRDKIGISDKADISDSAVVREDVYIGSGTYIGEHSYIGKNVKIYPNCFIGDNVKIGDNSVIFAGVRIYSECSVGNECTIHSGVIIGGDGFGFAPNSANNYQKVPQIGNVVIEDHVEVGANTTIDRATLGSTIIRKGVKLDNLIQIAHNVDIGENTVIAAQTGVAGSTKIGKNCMIGGQVGIVGHLKIADEVKIAAQSGIGGNISQVGAVVQGSPAFGIRDYKMSYVSFKKLPELRNQVESLQKEIENLKKQLS